MFRKINRESPRYHCQRHWCPAGRYGCSMPESTITVDPAELSRELIRCASVTPDDDGALDIVQSVAERLGFTVHGHIPDFCIVGEASNLSRIGQVIKNGRRGSINATFSFAGTAYFEASSLQATTVDVANTATNLVPARATARINIRFSDLHTGVSLEEHLRTVLARYSDRFTLEATISGEAFVTADSLELQHLKEAILATTGITPVFNTCGGTSDARFISLYCPVAEFGLTSETIHQVDERVEIDDLELLTRVYLAALSRFFARSPTGL